MEINKKLFLTISIILTILIPPHIILGLFFPLFLDINTLFLICLLYDICFFIMIYYSFVKDNKKFRESWNFLRYVMYYRGRIHMIIIPHMACFLFFFLIFQSLGSFYSPLKSVFVSTVLGIIVTVATLTAFFIKVKNREIRIIEEFEEIDRQCQRVLEDLKKFEKQG